MVFKLQSLMSMRFSLAVILVYVVLNRSPVVDTFISKSGVPLPPVEKQFSCHEIHM